MSETIKPYCGGNPEIATAVTELEIFIGDMDNADLADDSTVDTSDAVKALNVLIDRLNGSHR
jgi:hypothetical protein